MFNKSLQYSVAAQKRERHKLLRVVLALLFLFLLYNAVNTFLVSVWVMRSDSMQPGLQAGDRLLVVSSSLPLLFSELRGGGRAIPYGRGSMVLIDRGREERLNPFLVAADGLVRFVTAQQVSILGRGENLYVKRLVALPGDEVGMTNFVMRVRAAGTEFTLTEFELAGRPYHPNIPQIPALWDMTLPFSGHMDGTVLGPGEYFVVSDDRSSTGDSRTWGPVSARMIIGRPVLRFWPPARIGIP